MNREQHKQTIETFLSKTLGRFGLLQYSIELNDEADEYTAYLVDISNTTNKQRMAAVLMVEGDQEEVQLEVGEDFSNITYASFLGYLFMWNFCTWPDEERGIDLTIEKANKWDALAVELQQLHDSSKPEGMSRAAAAAFGYV